jgi:hypothetical protein
MALFKRSIILISPFNNLRCNINMNRLIKVAVISVGLTSFLSASALAGGHEDHKSVKPKVMIGLDQDLASFGAALEYEFTPHYGMELRHHFGGNTIETAGSTYSDASFESTTALLVTAQTPSLWGVSAYLQGGPAIVKYSLDNASRSDNALMYGGGIEYSFDHDKSLFIDAVKTDTSYEVDELDSKLISVGFLMKF